MPDPLNGAASAAPPPSSKTEKLPMENSETPFTITTQAGRKCPYCDKAAELLDNLGLPYRLRPLARSDLLEAASAAKMTTVPIIYHGVRLVGGFSELQDYVSLK